MKIFITGEPRVGKTTLIKEISEMLIRNGFKISGCITTDLIQNGKRVGFDIVDLLTKDKKVFASKLIKTECRFGSYYLNINNLDETFGNILKRNYDILIIDEIGKMEFLSKNFKEKINYLVNSNTKILATLHKDFVEKYKSYGNIFILTNQNKESVKNEIIKLIKKERNL